MKKTSILFSASIMLALMSCNSKTETTGSDLDSVNAEDVQTISSTSEVVPGSYINLNTGKTIYIIRDENTGYAVDSIAKVPVDFYINTSTKDTLYRTGVVVNNALIHESDGTWKLDETKIKIDGEEIKIKSGDYKEKIDGEESKIKSGDYKEKMDGADGKIKDGDSKIKIEDGEVTKQK